jgi:hypothetical protein
MELPVPTGGDFTPVPAGTYLARCYQFIDLGSHAEEYKGKPKPDLTHKVMISWELVDEMMPPNSNGEVKPFVISKRYTWSMSERARLRSDLESWRGAKFVQADFGPGGFDTRNLIGQPAILNIVQEEKDGRTYSNIVGITRPMKGMEVKPLFNPTKYLELTKAGFDRDVFNGLSDRLKQLIADSPEYMRIFGQTNGSLKPNADDPRTTYQQTLDRRQHEATLGPGGRGPGSSSEEDLDDEIPF